MQPRPKLGTCRSVYKYVVLEYSCMVQTCKSVDKYVVQLHGTVALMHVSALICLWHAPPLYACGMRSYMPVACALMPGWHAPLHRVRRARGPIYRTLSAEQRRVQPGARSSILAHGFIRLYRSTAPSPTRRCSYLCRPAPRMAVADPGDGYCPQCKTDDVKFEIRDSTFDIRTRICISVGKPRREE